MEAGRSVVHEGCIYFASYASETMLWYSVNSNEWKEQSMLYSNPGLAIINEYVATIGGNQNGVPTNEVYLWKNHEWEQYESMTHARSDPAVVTSSDHNYVVAVNGNLVTNYDISATASVEVCNVKESTWKSVCSLPSPHTRFEVALCGGILYVFPDQYSAGYKCSLSALTEDVNADWITIRGPPQRLSTFATLETCVICVGGADHESFGLQDIYIYDEKTDSWHRIERTLERGRMYSMVEVHSRKVFIVGGISQLTPNRRNTNRLDKVEIFDLTCNS